MKKIVTTVFLLAGLLLVSPSQTQAASDPVQFSCVNPVGQVVANYSSGVHGIPGRSERFEGSDVVYKIDQSYVLQCFCPTDSNDGIQSNWWRADNLSEAERDLFVRRGWIAISNGEAWGLASAHYLVKNESYTCGGVGGGGSDPSIAGRSGQVLGASTLAATGSSTQILLYGFLTITAGFAAWWSARA